MVLKSKITRKAEIIACIAMAVVLFAMHRSGLYETFALPLQILLSLVSFANPITGIFYLSAAQVIPDPPGIGLSSSQMAVVGFFLWHMLKFDFEDVTASRFFFWGAAPFLIWCTVCSLLPGGWGLRTVLILFYCMLTGYAAIILCRWSGNRVIHCIIAYLSAQTLAASLYWMVHLKLGTPVEIFRWELYGSSLIEGARMGTSRGNANTLGVPMALALSGVLLIMFKGIVKMKKTGVFWICGGAFFLLFACFPALIASGTRSAMISLAFGVALAFFNRRISMRNPLLSVAAVASALCVGAYCWFKFDLKKNWEEIGARAEYYQVTHGSGLLSGRDVVWQEAFDAVLNSPIIGGGKAEIKSYAGQEEMWASHSTYLDAGLLGGVPALVFFAGFVMVPFYVAWKHRHYEYVWLFLSCYTIAALTLTSLSGMQYKYLWVLWALFSVWIPKLQSRSVSQRSVGKDKQKRQRALLLPETATEH